jgi:hypothetical protein
MWEVIGKWWAGECKVLKDAPLFFFATFILGGVATFFVVSWHYDGRLEGLREIISNKDETIRQKDGLIDEYRVKLQGASPQEAAKRIDQLLADLDEAKRKVEKMNVGKPDRHLSPETKGSLKLALQSIVQSLPEISIVALPNPESQQYAKELRELFKDAGLRVTGVSWITFTTTKTDETYGVFIGVKSPDNPPNLAKKLQDAMNKSNFNIRIIEGDSENMSDTDIQIIIGYNP